MTAGYENVSFFLSDSDIFQDLILLCFVNLSAQLRGRIGRIPDLNAFEGCFQAFYEFIENAFLYKQTGACAAYLSLIEQNALARAVDSLVHICIIKYDIGRLAAQFKGNRDQLFHSSLIYAVADFRRTGESQLIQIRMIKHPLAAPAALAGDDIHNACRQNILNQTHEFHNGKGGMRGRLQYDGVACCQCRRQLPACHGEREVPRNDLSYHTDRFMENQGKRIVIEHYGRAFPCAEAACKIAEMIASQRNIGCHGFTDRFPVVQGFAHSQMFQVCINDIGNLQKDILSFHRRGLRPCGKRSAGSGNGCIHIFLRCFRKGSQFFSVCRVVAVKNRTVRCGNEFSVNKKSVLFLNVYFCHRKSTFHKSGAPPLYKNNPSGVLRHSR